MSLFVLQHHKEPFCRGWVRRIFRRLLYRTRLGLLKKGERSTGQGLEVTPGSRGLLLLTQTGHVTRHNTHLLLRPSQ